MKFINFFIFLCVIFLPPDPGTPLKSDSYPDLDRILIHNSAKNSEIFVLTLYSFAWELADCQFQSRNSPGLNPSILQYSGIWGAADEAVLNKVH